MAPDAEESFAEDDTCCELCEDHNEDSGADVDESEHANDESNALLPSIVLTTEDTQKMKGKNLKEHLGARGIPIPGVKVMLINQLTKALNDNVIA